MRQKVRGARQQCCKRVLLRQGLKISIDQAVQMIIRGGLEAGQFREILRRELTYVRANSQSGLNRRFKNTLSLGNIECASLAEDIGEVSQMLLGRFGNHLPANQLNVSVGFLLELRGNHMSAKQCGYHGASPLLCCSPDGAQRFQLRFGRQSIA